MFPDTTNNILKLLAIMVFADKRVFADEIDTFVNSARFFEASESELSPAKLLSWFETHRDDLKHRMENRTTFETWIYQILDNLSDHPDQQAILNKMIKISKADGEEHISERALIVLTARYWNISIAA